VPDGSRIERHGRIVAVGPVEPEGALSSSPP
jgi:hypothetical protein